MKIQLDYTNKTVTIESNVNLFEFTKRIKKVLPDWKDWYLQTGVITYWNNPIIWDYRHTPFYPTYYQVPVLTTTNGTDTVTITPDTTNVYCLDVN